VYAYIQDCVQKHAHIYIVGDTNMIEHTYSQMHAFITMPTYY